MSDDADVLPLDGAVTDADAAADAGSGVAAPESVEDVLDRLDVLVDEARTMPLSSSVVVNRGRLAGHLRELRDLLPEEFAQARWVVRERDDILERARADAERTLAEARAESERLIGEQHVVRAAAEESERILAAAEDTARGMRLEAEDYVDAKLANFEVVLQKTLVAVERGRERLRGRLDADALSEDGPDADADDDGQPAPGR